jgi:hypothetical protein
MTDWQQRVLDEKSELDARLARLKAFLEGPKAKALDPLQLDLMSRQAAYMTAYSSTLAERIELFGRP